MQRKQYLGLFLALHQIDTQSVEQCQDAAAANDALWLSLQPNVTSFIVADRTLILSTDTGDELRFTLEGSQG